MHMYIKYKVSMSKPVPGGGAQTMPTSMPTMMPMTMMLDGQLMIV